MISKIKGKKYIDKLQKLINEYNNKHNTSIKMTPVEASKDETSAIVFKNLTSKIHNTKNVKPKFKVGQRVRVYKWKNKFEKGSTENWTKEIFIITNVNKTDPITYKIKDLNDEPILGSFYTQELSATNF